MAGLECPAIFYINVSADSARRAPRILAHPARPGPKPSLRGGGPPGLRPVPHRAGALGPGRCGALCSPTRVASRLFEGATSDPADERVHEEVVDDRHGDGDDERSRDRKSVV